MRRFVNTIGAAIGLVLLLVFLRWGSVSQSKVSSDLCDYHRILRESSLDMTVKLELLDQIDFLRDEADQGRIVGATRWTEFDKIVREMLGERPSPEAAVFLEREFTRLHRDILTPESKPREEK